MGSHLCVPPQLWHPRIIMRSFAIASWSIHHTLIDIWLLHVGARGISHGAKKGVCQICVDTLLPLLPQEVHNLGVLDDNLISIHGFFVSVWPISPTNPYTSVHKVLSYSDHSDIPIFTWACRLAPTPVFMQSNWVGIFPGFWESKAPPIHLLAPRHST